MLFTDKVALVVDDSYTIRHQLKILLNKLNITVIEAHDKTSMVHRLNSDEVQVDLILMDLGFKKTTGFDLMSYIRSKKKYKDTPIIVLTGNALKQTVIAATKYQLAYYAIKPINPKDLCNKILSALEQVERTRLLEIKNSNDLEKVIDNADTENETKEILDTIHNSLSNHKQVKKKI